MRNSHDVGFVNGSNAVSLVIPGILECVLGDAFAGVFCDQLNTLHNSIHNLKQSDKHNKNIKQKPQTILFSRIYFSK